MPLSIRKRLQGVVTLASLEAKGYRYISVKESNGDFQGGFLVRRTRNGIVRGFLELKYHVKGERETQPYEVDVESISLKSLWAYDNIELMFDGIKELSRKESLVSFTNDTKEIDPETGEYLFQDGYMVYEPVTFVTYLAFFGKREIVYTKVNGSFNIYNVKMFSVYDAEQKALKMRKINNLLPEEMFERYEYSACVKQDGEFRIDKDVYGEQALMM
jgi:hypothetical protein